jgi:uncharacterized membrane protein (DUF2068 family)
VPSPSPSPSVAHASAAPPHRGLQLIAAFKFVKAAVLIAGGCAAVGLWGPGRSAWVHHWLQGLALDHGHRLAATVAGRALTLLGSAGPHRRHALAAGAFLYAAVFIVEGVGLALARRWAVYLTLAVTISFLPIEAVALWYRWTLPRVATIVLNGGVVVYLLTQLRTGPGPRQGADDGVAFERPTT